MNYKNNYKTIAYDVNDGVFADGTRRFSQDYEVNTQITIAAAPTREGYAFECWKEPECRPGDSYTVVEDHTFVAQWTENTTPQEQQQTEGNAPSPRSSQSSVKQAPKTGDGVNSLLPAALAGFACVGAVVLAAAGSRLRKEGAR